VKFYLLTAVAMKINAVLHVTPSDLVVVCRISDDHAALPSSG
jgi:hypothetical protein